MSDREILSAEDFARLTTHLFPGSQQRLIGHDAASRAKVAVLTEERDALMTAVGDIEDRLTQVEDERDEWKARLSRLRGMFAVEVGFATREGRDRVTRLLDSWMVEPAALTTAEARLAVLEAGLRELVDAIRAWDGSGTDARWVRVRDALTAASATLGGVPTTKEEQT